MVQVKTGQEALKMGERQSELHWATLHDFSSKSESGIYGSVMRNYKARQIADHNISLGNSI